MDVIHISWLVPNQELKCGSIMHGLWDFSYLQFYKINMRLDWIKLIDYYLSLKIKSS